ncbi:hypothetical protein HDU76_011200, partial [Blyttiomyces sp. JEL0837]
SKNTFDENYYVKDKVSGLVKVEQVSEIDPARMESKRVYLQSLFCQIQKHFRDSMEADPLTFRLWLIEHGVDCNNIKDVLSFLPKTKERSEIPTNQRKTINEGFRTIHKFFNGLDLTAITPNDEVTLRKATRNVSAVKDEVGRGDKHTGMEEADVGSGEYEDKDTAMEEAVFASGEYEFTDVGMEKAACDDEVKDFLVTYNEPMTAWVLVVKPNEAEQEIYRRRWVTNQDL